MNLSQSTLFAQSFKDAKLEILNKLKEYISENINDFPVAMSPITSDAEEISNTIESPKLELSIVPRSIRAQGNLA